MDLLCLERSEVQFSVQGQGESMMTEWQPKVSTYVPRSPRLWAGGSNAMSIDSICLASLLPLEYVLGSGPVRAGDE